MKVWLKTEDLKPEYRRLPIESVGFEQFPEEVKSVIRIVGRAIFQKYGVLKEIRPHETRDNETSQTIERTFTPKELRAIGCNYHQWRFEEIKGYTPEDTTPIDEYYVPLIADEAPVRVGGIIPDYKLSVDFRKDEHIVTWLSLAESDWELPHIKTLEQFTQLYTLLTGQQMKTTRTSA